MLGNNAGSDGDVTEMTKANVLSFLNVADGATADQTSVTGSSGSCTGNAATATSLATARNIGGVSFDGSANIDLPGVNSAGNQDTSGTATNATHVFTANNASTNEQNRITFVENAGAGGGNRGLEVNDNFTYNPSTNAVSAHIFNVRYGAISDGIVNNERAITIEGLNHVEVKLDSDQSSGAASNSTFRIINGSGNTVWSVDESGNILKDDPKIKKIDGTVLQEFESDGTLSASTFRTSGNSPGKFLGPTDDELFVESVDHLTFKIASGGASSKSFKFVNNTTEVGSIDSSGNLQIDGTFLTGDVTSSGNTATMAAVQTNITTITNTALKIGRDADNLIEFNSDNIIDFRIGSNDKIRLGMNQLRPSQDNVMNLGFGTIAFANLFLGSGATINFNNGDVVLTHSSDLLTLTGGNLDVPLLETDNITINGQQGTDGQVLTSTGSGVAWEDAASGGGSGDITAVVAGTGLNGGATTGSATLNIDAAQTGINSILATDLVLGEDAQTKIDFGTVNQIDMVADNTTVQTITSTTITNSVANFNITSGSASSPSFTLLNTSNDTSGSNFIFKKDKGAAAADNDILGTISFVGDDSGQNVPFETYATIVGSIATAAHGSEGGKLTFNLASHDGETQPGLILTDGSAEDEIDVTIGNGGGSVVTAAGRLTAGSIQIPDGSEYTGAMQFQTGSTCEFQDQNDNTLIAFSDDGITSLIAAGNLDIGAHQFRALSFQSDVATGTAPFVVASTTQVANLQSSTTASIGNLTGEVTSTNRATVIADNVVDEANLKVSNAPVNGYVLTAQSGNTGGLTWAEQSGGGSSSSIITQIFTIAYHSVSTSGFYITMSGANTNESTVLSTSSYHLILPCPFDGTIKKITSHHQNSITTGTSKFELYIDGDDSDLDADQRGSDLTVTNGSNVAGSAGRVFSTDCPSDWTFSKNETLAVRRTDSSGRGGATVSFVIEFDTST